MSSSIFNVILADLKERFGNRISLTPADLVEVLGTSEGQQANQRSEGSFPIPYTKDGGRIKITIYALAEYLARCSTASANVEVRKEIAASPDRIPRIEKKKRKGHLESGWWQLRCTAIYSIIRHSQMEFDLVQKTGFVGDFVKL